MPKHSAREVIAELERDDVLQALQEIERESVPKMRRSKKFCLARNGRHYPPKLAISFASAFRYADEPELHEGLDPEEFAGGPQSNEALRNLGFTIVDCNCGGVGAQSGSLPRDRQDKTLTVVRLVVNARAAMSPQKAFQCLKDTFAAMEKAGEYADIVITPGGFIEERLDLQRQVLGWDSPAPALAAVSRSAEKALAPFMGGLAKLSPPASFLTLGIDCMLPNNEQEFANAQLVATIDLKTKKVVGWTGKSYPTLSEERNLLQITDLDSHFQELGKWKCMILGCHDLNMFSPRSEANRDPKSNRGKRADDLARRAAIYRPEIVLQHPHTTDTPNIWMGGWSGVTRRLKPKTYASGICYYWPGHGKNRRARLAEVLTRTRLGDVTDYVWSGAGDVKKARSSRTEPASP